MNFLFFNQFKLPLIDNYASLRSTILDLNEAFMNCNTTNKTLNSLFEGYFLHGYTRHLILLTTLLCISMVRSNEMLFNITVICITDNVTKQNIEPIEITSEEISIVFASSAIGLAIAVLPISYLLFIYGTRNGFTLLLIISALTTAAIPYTIQFGLFAIICARVLQGISMSATLPMIGIVSSRWAPISEAGQFVTVLSMSGQLSQMFTMPAAAYFCVTSGWPQAYYTNALLSLGLAMLFFSFYHDSPANHPNVAVKELLKITGGAKLKKNDIKLPYRAIASSKAVWAVWIAFFGNAFGYQLIVRYMPTYFNKALNVPVERTGLSSFIPPAMQLLVKSILSACADRIKCINELHKLQLFNSLSMIGCGLLLLPLGFLNKNDELIALICFTTSISCIAFETCGSMKSATLIARHFTQFVMAVVQLFACIGMLLVPFMVTVLAPNNTVLEWRYVVFTVATIHTIANIAFCSMCSEKAQSWALTDVYDENIKDFNMQTI